MGSLDTPTRCSSDRSARLRHHLGAQTCFRTRIGRAFMRIRERIIPQKSLAYTAALQADVPSHSAGCCRSSRARCLPYFYAPHPARTFELALSLQLVAALHRSAHGSHKMGPLFGVIIVVMVPGAC